MRATQQKVATLSFTGSSMTAALCEKSTTLSPKQIDTSFNFDLDRMKKAVEAKSHAVPNTLKNLDDFDAWLNQLPL